MGDFINQIRIRYKIIISFSIIAISLILLAAYQYNLYLALSGTEKSNKRIIETISIINNLKTTLADVQYLQTEIIESTDTNEIVNLNQKWQELNLNFRRNYNSISGTAITEDIAGFQEEWIEMNTALGKVRKQYDSLIAINMDSTVSLVVNRYKLIPKENQNLQENEELNEEDLIYGAAENEEEASLEETPSEIIALPTEAESTEEIVNDFAIPDLFLEDESQGVDLEAKMNEINIQLIDLKKSVNIGYQSIHSILNRNENLLYRIIPLEREAIVEKAQSIINRSGFIILIGMIIAFVMAIWIIGKINVPLEIITKGIRSIRDGNLEISIAKTESKDELGEIQNTLNDAISELNKINGFASALAKNNINENHTAVSDDDMISPNLFAIQQNLKKQLKEKEIRVSADTKYSWINDGIAKFNTLLRQYNQDLPLLADSVLGELIKYVQAMQGGLFVKVLHENNEENFMLELMASYAYNRKKYYKRNIMKGEGLVGTVAVEGKKILLTNLPDDYMEIRSGLGGTEPRCLLVVPMIINDKTLGVLEIASLNLFQEFEIEFIEKVAESIAASISSIKVNEQTSFLLEQSRKQAEELGHEQYERQNIIKELQEAQERALHREEALKKSLAELEIKNNDLKEKDMQVREKIEHVTLDYRKAVANLQAQQQLQNNIFERALDGVIIIDGQGIVTFVNPAAEKLWNYSKDEMLGVSINSMMPNPHNENHDEYINNYLRTGIKKIIGTGRSVPIKTKSGEIRNVFIEIIDTSVGSDIYFTAIIKDMADIQTAHNEILQLNRHNTRLEYKYQKYINELSKLLDENNIDIPELEGSAQKLIENSTAMMLGKDLVDPTRIDIINSLNTAYQHALAENLNKSVDVFNQLIKQFKDYFKLEEELAAQNEFEEVKEHKKYHKRITIKLLEYKDLTKHGDFIVVYEYFDEIKKLVAQHFENEDKNIAPYLT